MLSRNPPPGRQVHRGSKCRRPPRFGLPGLAKVLVGAGGPTEEVLFPRTTYPSRGDVTLGYRVGGSQASDRVLRPLRKSRDWRPMQRLEAESLGSSPCRLNSPPVFTVSAEASWFYPVGQVSRQKTLSDQYPRTDSLFTKNHTYIHLPRSNWGTSSITNYHELVLKCTRSNNQLYTMVPAYAPYNNSSGVIST